MTKARRVGSVLTGLIILLFGLSFAVDPDSVYSIIILILGFSLLLSGIRSMIYYATMARHMVGGKSVLYRAVIILDLGIFTLSLNHVPLIFVVLYLAGIHGFSGIIDILRAMESKRLQASSWKLSFSHGVINVIMAALCLVFLKTVEVAVVIYTLGLVYSGAMRIIQGFRRTDAVYIE